MTLDVVCLCAQWCGTCREYQPVFEQLQRTVPAARTHWIDVEAHEDAVDDIDITTFPMILIVNDRRELCFAGPVTPHGQTLARLCEAAEAGNLRVKPEQALPWRPLLERLGLHCPGA